MEKVQIWKIKTEIYKFLSFEFEIIWRTKRHQMELPSLYLAKVMAIPDSFQELLTFCIQKI
jgi:hypothetical protein